MKTERQPTMFIRLVTLLATITMFGAACGSADEPALGGGPTTSAALATTTSTSTNLAADDAGLAQPASEYGAVNDIRGEEEPEITNLPEPFEVLVTLFQLEGNVVVGFSPFEPPDRSCLEARFASVNGRPRAYAVPITEGIDCSTFSPFLQVATEAFLIECETVRLVRTDVPVDALAAPSADLVAAVTTPRFRDGVNWIGTTFSTPIEPDELPSVDLDDAGCEEIEALELDPDIPRVRGLSTLVGIDRVQEDGLRANYETIGESAEEVVRDYLGDWLDWGEILEQGTHLEARHDDGRYVVLNAESRGLAPGLMMAYLCVWPTEPADTSC